MNPNSAFNFLQRHGLTNVDALDLGHYIDGKRSAVFAFCTSDQCCIDIFGKKSKVRKNVDGSATDCPDCGHALVWRTRKGEKAAA